MTSENATSQILSSQTDQAMNSTDNSNNETVTSYVVSNADGDKAMIVEVKENSMEVLKDKETNSVIGALNIPKASTDVPVYTQDQRKEKAIKFLSDKIPVENYTYIDEDCMDNSFYSVNFSVLINGYRSGDFAFVNMDKDGSITGYAAPYVGLFDNLEIPKIDENKLISTVEEQIKSQYGEIPSYKIENKIINVDKNGKWQMVFMVLFEEEFKEGQQYTVDII